MLYQIDCASSWNPARYLRYYHSAEEDADWRSCSWKFDIGSADRAADDVYGDSSVIVTRSFLVKKSFQHLSLAIERVFFYTERDFYFFSFLRCLLLSIMRMDLCSENVCFLSVKSRLFHLVRFI